MKDRIVIADTQAIDEWHRTIACFVDTDNSIYKAKYEQIPETYEELRHLCIEISTKEDHIHIFNDWGTNNEYLMTHSLKFYPDGKICVHGDNGFVVATNKTAAEMWDIIKALLEVKK